MQGLRPCTPFFSSRGDDPNLRFLLEKKISTSLRQAAVALEDAGVGCLVVGAADAVEGVVSERDILRAVAEGLDLDATSVSGVESRELKWATPDSTIGEVAQEMMENYVRHVPVGADRRLVGMLSIRDALAALLA